MARARERQDWLTRLKKVEDELRRLRIRDYGEGGGGGGTVSPVRFQAYRDPGNLPSLDDTNWSSIGFGSDPGDVGVDDAGGFGPADGKYHATDLGWYAIFCSFAINPSPATEGVVELQLVVNALGSTAFVQSNPFSRVGPVGATFGTHVELVGVAYSDGSAVFEVQGKSSPVVTCLSSGVSHFSGHLIH